MKLTLTVISLNPAGSNQAVAVGLQPSVDSPPAGTPQPQPLVVYMNQADGDELELGEQFTVEIKPDKP